MNQTVFTSEDVVLNISEKAIIVTLWLLIELVGSCMLIGLIQFERLNGDPLKRRIVDQVRNINTTNSSQGAGTQVDLPTKVSINGTCIFQCQMTWGSMFTKVILLRMDRAC